MGRMPAEAPAIGEPPVTRSAPARRSLWARIRASRFLFVSILVHLLFAVGAAVYVVQVYTPKRKLTFKGGPPSPNHSERSIEHKVQLAKKQSTMSAPAVKRIVSTGLAKVTLSEMPAIPDLNAAPTKMVGLGGAGFGMPSALTGTQGSSAGGGPISFFGLHESGGGSFAGTLYDLKQKSNRVSTDMTAGTNTARL